MKLLHASLLLIGLVSLAAAQEKGNADPEGLKEAKKDVEAFKLELKKMTADQLVNEFIPAGRRRYGGYEYYYKYMANIAIRRELASRGHSAESTLRKNVTNMVPIWEAINGPGETIGKVCEDLLSKLRK